MVIRILLTIIFLIIGIYNYRRGIIIEKEKNPKLKKDGKLNLLSSAIPYTLSKIFFIYVMLMVFSVLFLQSLCTEKSIVNTYEITSISKEYVDNTRKNQSYTFNNKEETIKIKGIDMLEIKENTGKLCVEKYELISKYDIVNILMYGAYENGLTIYK